MQHDMQVHVIKRELAHVAMHELGYGVTMKRSMVTLCILSVVALTSGTAA